jgi:predicted enzyme related to lactoylglutathione lyase
MEPDHSSAVFHWRHHEEPDREGRDAGAELAGGIEESEYGRFAWILDPDGTRIELWEPPAGS